MDKFIQEIVEIDRDCAKSVKEAKKKRSEVQTNMNAKKKEIYEAFMSEQQKIIQEHKDKLQSEIETTKKRNDKEFEASLTSLESQYVSNKDTWVETIVERCKEV